MEIKRAVIIFISVLFFLSSFGVIYAESYKYNDKKTGLSFIVPDGWQEEEITNEYYEFKIVPNSNDGALIMYAVKDIWSTMSQTEKIGKKRSDIDNSIFTDDKFKAMLSEEFNLSSEFYEFEMITYNEQEYYNLTITSNLSLFDVDTGIVMMINYIIHDGYMYAFFYGDFREKTHYNEFEELMNSINYPVISNSSNSFFYIDGNGKLKVNIILLIFSVILTLSVYVVPVVIYRFCIRKRSMLNKNALIFTIVFAFVSFVVMFYLKSLFAGGFPNSAVPIVWSFVNYRILIKKTQKDVDIKYNPNTDPVLLALQEEYSGL